jgi:hypothetical protein
VDLLILLDFSPCIAELTPESRYWYQYRTIYGFARRCPQLALHRSLRNPVPSWGENDYLHIGALTLMMRENKNG